MNIKTILSWAVGKLKKVEIDSAVLDAEVLLGFVLKKDKTFLFAHPDKNIKTQEYKKIKKYVSRRVKREPIAYITNNKEFYGLDFCVDKNVLIPRPETELMVDEAIKIIWDSKRPITLIDVGTGSGCIPISILKWIPAFVGMAAGVDFSKPALKIARINAKKNNVASRVKFVHSNLLEKIKVKKNILITANLPYLTTEQYKNLPLEIKEYEPRSAIVGGEDGLRYYRELLKQIKKMYSPNKSEDDKMWVLLEIDPTQAKPIKELIKKYFPNAKIQIKKDLAGLNRLVVVNF